MRKDFVDRLEASGDDWKSGKEYDFIVVGAGAAGSVVASRLADRGVRVLLLEAGEGEPFQTALPTMEIVAPTYDDERFDWRYESTVQKEAVRGTPVSGFAEDSK